MKPLTLILEAILLTAENPLTIDELSAAFDEQDLPGREELIEALFELKQDCENHAYELVMINQKYRLQTKGRYASYVARLQAEKPQKYSKAILEILAIIAYRQPITRGEIEAIRGVAVNPLHIKTLIEREWIKTAGQKDTPGRPTLYVTTPIFLQYFQLNGLVDLPELNPIVVEL